ncbi:thioredoxin-like protein [Lojkania enalia]|uniref:Thioredoxin-like protein n=1 Tax=Lojkania enalia TaxID=147567 RepID=A0A9P4NBE3_9PLEO|nr:thioredoxin-like protein [Didymosphaeria enalia]
MPYESAITFTLDTICPWTYIAYLRLHTALTQYRAAHPTAPVTFTLKFAPYQLYPDFSKQGEDKYAWYVKEKFAGDEQRMRMFVEYMETLGRAEGVEIDFGGHVAGTMDAHRVVGWVQGEKGEEAAERVVGSLYKQYFTQRAHPSSRETLLEACLAAGLSEKDARGLVEDGNEGLMEAKMAIQEQVGNGVDSVPYVVFEGRKRDFTLVGAKEVGEYVKTLEQVGKEA